MPPSANTGLPAGAPTTCRALPESESVPYSMQDTQPSTSVPSKAIWRSRM